MPGISAPRTGHRAGRSGSLRSSLLLLVLVPCLGLAAAWGYAAVLLHDAGDRTALVAGSVVVAVVLLWSLLSGARLARSLGARLADLRSDTLAVAQREIPEVVGRLHGGESVPTPPAWVPSRRGGDELQQAADGLGAVRQAAVAAIIHQAQGREGTKKVFLNIARRTQILIHRQISMLDALEREHEEPELLRELFAVDHLATRMRRNAENLVILGGALPARRWRNAVPMVNVLRSAVSETENYARVVVQGVPRASLSGQAVADVIHLVAELIENGTTFSPPYTQVQVSAQEVPKGLAVEVEDRGLGMGEEEYERLNDYLANPPELDVSALGDDLRLGLFVVARLAARHDIQVTLRPSPYGGTRAVVLVPSVLLEQPDQPASVPGLPSGARVTRMPVGDGSGAGEESGTGQGGLDGGIDEELAGALAGVLGGLLGQPSSGGAPGAPAGPFGRTPDFGKAPEFGGAREFGGASEFGESPAFGGPSEFGQEREFGGASEFGEVADEVIVGELLNEGPRFGPPVIDGNPVGPGVRAGGGLPVGAEIPGLPGAVVVPRPALPQPYEVPGLTAPVAAQAQPASAALPVPTVSAPPASVPAVSAPMADVPMADGDPAAGRGGPDEPGGQERPVHERAREEQHLDHGPDGELRTPRVLPQRVRNASLAEQLREANAPGGAGAHGTPPHRSPSLGTPPSGSSFGVPSPGTPSRGTPLPGAADDELSPQRSRATMAAIQRGTRSARASDPDSDATAAPPAPAAPSAAKDQQ
ncbi:ATP-binding protein [Kitasatospora sp. NPDC004240]